MSKKKAHVEVTLLVDNTGSMGEACRAARESASEVATLLGLLMGQPSLHIAVYGDYDRSTPNREIGGYSRLVAGFSAQEEETWLAKFMKPMGGGGMPEAARTALNLLVKRDVESKEQKQRPVPRRILFIFTDAPPHDPNSRLDNEGQQEEAYLRTHALERNWTALTAAVRKHYRVVTFAPAASLQNVKRWFTQLGEVSAVSRNTSEEITKCMMTALADLLGQRPAASAAAEEPAGDGQGNSSIVYWSPTYQDNPRAGRLHRLDPFVSVDMMARMRAADPEFVITAFDRLLDTSRPRQALALTTNNVLGKYWRALCGRMRFAEDGKWADKCQAVMDKLSKSCGLLNPKDRAVLKKWIDESHDDTPVIREMISSALEANKAARSAAVPPADKKAVPSRRYRYFVLPNELRDSISLDDILELGRGGRFAPLAKLISSLEAVEQDKQLALPDDVDTAPTFIPAEGLPPLKVFRLVANLLKPGLLFSRQVAMMTAVLAARNKHLGSLARGLLEKAKGSWVSWERDQDGKQKSPVFWSINFIRLLKLAPDAALVPREKSFRNHYLRVATVVRNHDATIELTVPLRHDAPRKGPTWKRKCKGCGHHRCFSTFPKGAERCGVCMTCDENVEDNREWIREAKSRNQTVDPAERVGLKGDVTHWAQCHTCKANYGIAHISTLNVRPKCYRCRSGLDPSVDVVSCAVCLHRYCSPGGSASAALARHAEDRRAVGDGELASRLEAHVAAGTWVCPRCVVSPKSLIATSDVKISKLIEENPDLTRLIPLSPYTALMDAKLKLWKRVLEVKSTDDAKAVAGVGDVAISDDAKAGAKADAKKKKTLTLGGFRVHDAKDAEAQLLKLLLTHSGFTPCPLCACDAPVRDMVPACGGCPQRICRDCRNGWYGQVQAGRAVARGHTACPFCKEPARFDAVRSLFLSRLRNVRPGKRGRDVCAWDAKSVYAACLDCETLKPALDRDCARAAPTVRNFVCAECREAHAKMILDDANDVTDRKCPSCGAPTEKNGGCDHITCICGAHWCHGCGAGEDESGELFDSYTIYEHMRQCSGWGGA